MATTVLGKLLQSTDLAVLEWVDRYHGNELERTDFYHASSVWVDYCLREGKHYSLLAVHAWHLLLPLVQQWNMLAVCMGIETHPVTPTQLLQGWLATQPSLSEVVTAVSVTQHPEVLQALENYRRLLTPE